MKKIFTLRNKSGGSTVSNKKNKLTNGPFKPHCNQGTEISFLICEREEIAWEPSTRDVLDRPHVLHICWIFSFTANPDSVQLEEILLGCEEITQI
jgi:hypothetical protein